MTLSSKEKWLRSLELCQLKVEMTVARSKSVAITFWILFFPLCFVFCCWFFCPFPSACLHQLLELIGLSSESCRSLQKSPLGSTNSFLWTVCTRDNLKSIDLLKAAISLIWNVCTRLWVNACTHSCTLRDLVPVHCGLGSKGDNY